MLAFVLLSCHVRILVKLELVREVVSLVLQIDVLDILLECAEPLLHLIKAPRHFAVRHPALVKVPKALIRLHITVHNCKGG